MIHVRLVALLAASAALAACGGLPKGQGAMYPVGSYEFFEHAQGQTTDFRGRVMILGDSVELAETSPACIESRGAKMSNRIQTFACGDFALTASRETGQWNFRYRTERTVREDVTVCTAYDTTSGRQVCKATKVEHRERQVPVSGTLRLTRLTM